MVVCPCGQTIEDTCAWPPYRTATYDKAGNVIFAICIHGCVVIDRTKDKENDKTVCCGKHMSYVDGWWLCTACGKHFRDEDETHNGT